MAQRITASQRQEKPFSDQDGIRPSAQIQFPGLTRKVPPGVLELRTFRARIVRSTGEELTVPYGTTLLRMHART